MAAQLLLQGRQLSLLGGLRVSPQGPLPDVSVFAAVSSFVERESALLCCGVSIADTFGFSFYALQRMVPPVGSLQAAAVALAAAALPG